MRLVARRPLARVVRVDRPLVERVVVPSVVALPVRRGQPLGEVRVYYGRRVVGRRPLVAAESVERPGTAGRVTWYVGRAAQNVWSWLT